MSDEIVIETKQTFEAPTQPKAEMTPEAQEHFDKYYDVDITNFNSFYQQVLLDFHQYGASQAIMNVIGQLQDYQRQLDTQGFISSKEEESEL